MAYDQALADRVRELIAKKTQFTERKMFGGLAFLVGGNMAIAASGQGGLLVRVVPAQSATLARTSRAKVAEMRGREMPGWLRVDADDVETRAELEVWVSRAVSFARSLPDKASSATGD